MRDCGGDKESHAKRSDRRTNYQQRVARIRVALAAPDKKQSESEEGERYTELAPLEYDSPRLLGRTPGLRNICGLHPLQGRQ